MLRQRSGNVVWTLSQRRCPMLGTDIHTIFRQHCVKIVSVLVPNVVIGWFRSRMTVTFKFEFSTQLHQHASLHRHGSWVNSPSKATQLCQNGNSPCQKHILALISNSCFSFYKSPNHVSNMIILTIELYYYFYQSKLFHFIKFYFQNGKLNFRFWACSSNVVATLR